MAISVLKIASLYEQTRNDIKKARYTRAYINGRISFAPQSFSVVGLTATQNYLEIQTGNTF